MPLAPALLFLALAAAPARADLAKCTAGEARGWDIEGDPALGPYRRVAVDPYYSDACKRELLGFTADFLGYAPQAGLCPGQRCQVYARAAGAVSAIANSSGKPLCLSGSLTEATAAPQSPPACKLDPEYASTIDLADHWLATQ